MTCAVEQRDELREARRALVAFEAVAGADVLAPTQGELDRWTLELAIRTTPKSPADRLEPRHLDAIQSRGLGVESSVSRGPAGQRVLLTR
jgi:hypothetical protein